LARSKHANNIDGETDRGAVGEINRQTDTIKDGDTDGKRDKKTHTCTNR